MPDQIKVESYAGYKAEEEPRVFEWLGERHEIKEILSRWMETDIEDERRRKFLVRTADGHVYELVYNEKDDSWWL